MFAQETFSSFLSTVNKGYEHSCVPAFKSLSQQALLCLDKAKPLTQDVVKQLEPYKSYIIPALATAALVYSLWPRSGVQALAELTDWEKKERERFKEFSKPIWKDWNYDSGVSKEVRIGFNMVRVDLKYKQPDVFFTKTTQIRKIGSNEIISEKKEYINIVAGDPQQIFPPSPMSAANPPQATTLQPRTKASTADVFGQ